MLKIRLQRVGRKNDASFRLVVIESTKAPQAGNYLEMLGSYSPKSNVITVKADRVKHWISVGAQVSDSAHNLLVSEGVIVGKKKNVLPKKSPIIDEEALAKAKEETKKKKAEENIPEDKKTEEVSVETEKIEEKDKDGIKDSKEKDNIEVVPKKEDKEDDGTEDKK